MFNKKVLIGMLTFVIIVFIGFIQINIVNTQALSPIGNGNDNYELVKEEFGEDFEEFIKDNAEVKIYRNNEENKNTIVRVEDKEFMINTNNTVLEKIYGVGNKVYSNLIGIKNSISEKIKKNNSEKNNLENKEGKEKNNEEKDNNLNTNKSDEKLNKIIEEFLEKSN